MGRCDTVKLPAASALRRKRNHDRTICRVPHDCPNISVSTISSDCTTSSFVWNTRKTDARSMNGARIVCFRLLFQLRSPMGCRDKRRVDFFTIIEARHTAVLGLNATLDHSYQKNTECNERDSGNNHHNIQKPPLMRSAFGFIGCHATSSALLLWSGVWCMARQMQ